MKKKRIKIMKHLKKINEGWFNKGKNNKTQFQLAEEHRKKVYSMFELLGKEIEKDPKVQEIINKIKNEEFSDVYIMNKDEENNEEDAFFIKMNNGDIVKLLWVHSTGPGEDGTQYLDGDYILVYKIYLNNKDIVDWISICNKLYPNFSYGFDGGTYLTNKTGSILHNIVWDYDNNKKNKNTWWRQ
jgi:hypothetical protein